MVHHGCSISTRYNWVWANLRLYLVQSSLAIEKTIFGGGIIIARAIIIIIVKYHLRLYKEI